MSKRMSSKIECGFDCVDGKHVPTVKVMLEPCGPDDSAAWEARDLLAKKVEQALAAPVVERQPDFKPVMTLEAERLFGGAGEYAFSVADHAWLDGCRKEGGTFKLYTAPPELAELQATIDKLREGITEHWKVVCDQRTEIERLLSGFWQQVTDADLKKIADFVGDGDLPANSFFMRKEAGDLANMTMHMVREVQALRTELERLKGGQGEAMAWIRKWAADGITPEKVKNENGRMAWPFKYKLVPVSQAKCLPDDVALFASQPAPVSVLLPDRIEPPSDYAYRKGWNACLDKVKELNQ